MTLSTYTGELSVGDAVRARRADGKWMPATITGAPVPMPTGDDEVTYYWPITFDGNYEIRPWPAHDLMLPMRMVA